MGAKKSNSGEPEKEPRDSAGRPPGRTIFSCEQQEAFLQLLTSGFGVNMAIRETKLTWWAYEGTLAADPEFARRVKAAKVELHERHVAVLNASSLGGNLEAAKFLVGRYDTGRRFVVEMKVKQGSANDSSPQSRDKRIGKAMETLKRKKAAELQAKAESAIEEYEEEMNQDS